MRNLNEIREFILKMNNLGFKLNFKENGAVCGIYKVVRGISGCVYSPKFYEYEGGYVRRISDGKIVDLAIN